MGKAPPLRDDCFAMPRGVDWIPVQDALEKLRSNLHPVVGVETIPIQEALGRILAEDVVAHQSHPPFSNAAVDGYGFAFDDLPAGEEITLPMEVGQAAAGHAFGGSVRSGHALRILTGAKVPQGVDTIVLQEDVNVEDGYIHFRSGLKKGANTREEGEDIKVGAVILTTGTKLRADRLGVLASAGITEAQVYQRLRVAVLSTGDELEADKAEATIPDANRPMLLGLLRQMGYEPVDIGIIPDDVAAVRDALTQAANTTDVILTTGGASSGDEDHISKLLNREGNMQSWRVAIKPGRPIALALWNGVPVFGLPGNPVAAFVCTLVFASPAMGVLSGSAWKDLKGYMLPAAFAKNKKEGREEYLRARLDNEGAVEVFASEGSGRISGLSWADGLVRLQHGAATIKTGDLVEYIPFSKWLE